MDRIQEILSHPMQLRQLTISKDAINSEARTVELSISSEAVIDRGWYKEILDHKMDSIRLGRMIDKAAFLDNHDPDRQIGVIERCWLDETEGKLRALVRFSKSPMAEEVFQDIVDGIKTKVSVGYQIHSVILESKDEDTPTYRITDWEPLEASIVSIPVDNSVGVGRSEDGFLQRMQQAVQDIENKSNNNITIKEARQMADENPVNPEQIIADERARVSEIRSLGTKHNIDTAQAEKEGWSIERFRGFVLDKIGPDKPLSTPSSDVGMSEKEVRSYSILNAIRGQLTNDWTGAELEREAHAEISKRGIKGHGGIFIPYQVMTRAAAAMTTAGGGAGLVGTTLKPESFIELLRSKQILPQLGVQRLPGLVGNIAIPKQTGGSAVGWVTEGQDIPLTDAVFEQVSLSPKTVAGYEEYTRNLLLQGTPGIESLVVNDLSKKIALASDLAGIQGTGLNGQPKGILNVDGIGNVAGAAYNYASLLEHQTDVESANADAPTMFYLVDPALRGAMKAKPKTPNQAIFLCSEDNMAAGYKMMATNQMPEATNLFGDFSQLLMGEWGVLEILVNPYQATNGNVRVFAYYTVDFACRQVGAFSAAKEIVLA